MLLLCHDDTCNGHAERAGSDPDGSCRFCSAPLTDDLGVILLRDARREEPESDLQAILICGMAGHVFEGMVLRDQRLAGACSRCALRVTLAP